MKLEFDTYLKEDIVKLMKHIPDRHRVIEAKLCAKTKPTPDYLANCHLNAETKRHEFLTNEDCKKVQSILRTCFKREQKFVSEYYYYYYYYCNLNIFEYLLI